MFFFRLRCLGAGFFGFFFNPPPPLGFDLVSLSFYWVLLGFTRFPRVLLFFFNFDWILLGFTQVLLGFPGFSWYS